VARRFRLSSLAWPALALLGLLAPALASGVGAHPAIDWQPGRALEEPWRLWSAAWVHLSRQHLVVNAAAALVVAMFGVAAQMPARATLAWALAWPLTHAALALRPEISHYGGLSGVLHAGVAVVALWLVRAEVGWRRAIAALVLGGVTLKVLLEAPWRSELPLSAALGITTVPFAHAAGVVVGCVAATVMWRRQ